MGERPPSRSERDEAAAHPLDSSFVFVNSKNYRKYFKKGKVFRTLWPEPANSTEQHRDGIVDIAKWGEQIVVKIHWFVVVQSFTSHCLVVPVHTYDGRGATKSGINADDHCALVAKGQFMMLLDGERLSRAPLHLIVENSDIQLKPSSRINFSKVHTVEYNIKISTVGRIAPEDVPTMVEYWHQSITKARGEDTSIAQSWRSVRPRKPMGNFNGKRPSMDYQKPGVPSRRTAATFQDFPYRRPSPSPGAEERVYKKIRTEPYDAIPDDQYVQIMQQQKLEIIAQPINNNKEEVMKEEDQIWKDRYSGVSSDADESVQMNR